MSTFPINFLTRFASSIREGTKLQTIRRNRRDGRRPEPGDLVKLYTGLRTSHVKLLRQSVVQRCRAVRIDFEEREIVVDGDRLVGEERAAFARADGFFGWEEMFYWFREQYGCEGATVFDGFCVEWA